MHSVIISGKEVIDSEFLMKVINSVYDGLSVVRLRSAVSPLVGKLQ